MSAEISDVIPRPETKKILDIQALRGFAVLIVIFEHLSLSATLWASIGWKKHPAGWSGVQLFFIISGFVVTLSFVKKQFRVGPFFAKRIARLYPAMLVVITALRRRIRRSSSQNPILVSANERRCLELGCP